MALSQRGKLSIAAWLESNTAFRLPSRANGLDEALQTLDAPSNSSSKLTSSTTKPKSYLAQCEQLQRYFQRGLCALFALTFVLGLLAVPPAFTVSSSGKVNIFWLLITMLGFHGINLVLWCVGMLALGRQSGHSKGMLLTSLIFISNKIRKHSTIDTDANEAFWHWQCPAHSNRWLLSVMSHTAWLSYLFAGLLMTLLLLLTNQVNFVWETTLLSDQQFLSLTQHLSALPHWLGFSVPNQADIVASRVDIASQSASTRQHWASLLLASLCLYGVLPRLLLSIFSVAMYRIKRLTLPKTTQEQAIERRYKEQGKASITDHDSQPKPQSVPNDRIELKTLPNDAFQQHWGLFEWSQVTPVELAGSTSVVVLNDAQQQQALLKQPCSDDLYLLVSGEHSPDRGSRRFLMSVTQVYPHASLVVATQDGETFVEAWLRNALEAGMNPDHCFALHSSTQSKE